MGNTFIVNPSNSELQIAILEFEEKVKAELHPVAVGALTAEIGDRPAAPSLATHSGYMLGRLCLASVAYGGRSEFGLVAYVASKNHSLIVLRQSGTTESKGEVANDLSAISRSASTGGVLVLDLLQSAVARVSEQLKSIGTQLEDVRRVVRGIPELSQRRSSESLNDSQKQIFLAEVELFNLIPLIKGLVEIGSDLAEDKLDLLDASGQEMFGPDLEISASEISLQSRQLKIEAGSLTDGFKSVISDIQMQHSDLQRRSNRYMSSIAVLVLEPIVLINLYSEFFAEGKIWSNSLTTNYPWVVVVLAELGLFAFLRSRKWLK